jgi:hypothetical protein
MTPLAHRIVKELTLPKSDRTFVDRCGLLGEMQDIHCFDLSEVQPLLQDLGMNLHNKAVDAGVSYPSELAFLPAPRTWLEMKMPGGWTVGALLIDRGDDYADVYWSIWSSSAFLSASGVGLFPLGVNAPCVGSPVKWVGPKDFVSDSTGNLVWLAMLYAALAMINTPRVIGRRQHAPHRGLVKSLAKSGGGPGKFPLNAWTEIVLRVTPPVDYSGDPPVRGNYTGEQARHFVRTHLRLWAGTLILITGHYRGNIERGFRQSRYKLKPLKHGAPPAPAPC